MENTILGVLVGAGIASFGFIVDIWKSQRGWSEERFTELYKYRVSVMPQLIELSGKIGTFLHQESIASIEDNSPKMTAYVNAVTQFENLSLSLGDALINGLVDHLHARIRTSEERAKILSDCRETIKRLGQLLAEEYAFSKTSEERY